MQNIETTKILSGKCDHPFVPGFFFKKHLGEICWIIIIINILVLKFIFNWAFLAALFVGIISGVIIGGIITPILDKISILLKKRETNN